MRPEDADCFHARQIFDYIVRQRVGLQPLTRSARRTLQRWAHGGQARGRTAERILNDLGLSVRDLPPESCRTYDNGKSGKRKARR